MRDRPSLPSRRSASAAAAAAPRARAAPRPRLLAAQDQGRDQREQRHADGPQVGVRERAAGPRAVRATVLDPVLEDHGEDRDAERAADALQHVEHRRRARHLAARRASRRPRPSPASSSRPGRSRAEQAEASSQYDVSPPTSANGTVPAASSSSPNGTTRPRAEAVGQPPADVHPDRRAEALGHDQQARVAAATRRAPPGSRAAAGSSSRTAPRRAGTSSRPRRRSRATRNSRTSTSGSATRSACRTNAATSDQPDHDRHPRDRDRSVRCWPSR